MNKQDDIVLAIVGSRSFHDKQLFTTTVNEWIKCNKKPVQIVSGGARGADTLAKVYATSNNIPLTEFLPEYGKYKRCAPLVRNSQIADISTHCIAFPSHKGSGTQDTIKKMKLQKKPVYIVYIDNPQNSTITKLWENKA